MRTFARDGNVAFGASPLLHWVRAPLPSLLDTLGGLLRRQFVDPSRNWPQSPIKRLEFRSADHSLCGVALGERIATARSFGPADYMTGGRSDPDLYYLRLGLVVGCFENEIVSFQLVMDPPSRETRAFRRLDAASLAIRAPGSGARTLDCHTSEDEVLHWFGTPYETGPVGPDRMHTFLVDGSMVETSHDPTTGLLVQVDLCLSSERDSRCA